MTDIAATILLHFGIVIGFAFTLRLSGRTVLFKPLLGGLACTAAYWLIIILSSEAQGMVASLSDLRWNWVGKVCAIFGTLLLIRIIPSLAWREVGLSLGLNPGSVRSTLVVAAILCGFAWLLEAIANDGTDTSVERLLFQSLMPGVDEELFMRGLLLALFVRAFGASRLVAGASFGAAELALTFLFAAGHGLRVVNGAIALDFPAFATTAFLGAGLAWLRQRTGSLGPSILVHNAINLGNSFF
jgi:membrane protease YdiL (CAAX protease family)